MLLFTLGGIHRFVLGGLAAAAVAAAPEVGDELWGGLSSLPPTRREGPPSLALPSSIIYHFPSKFDKQFERKRN